LGQFLRCRRIDARSGEEETRRIVQADAIEVCVPGRRRRLQEARGGRVERRSLTPSS